jgi:site-specific DNA recombinase
MGRRSALSAGEPVEAGKSGGGNSYGYDVVMKFTTAGEPERGDRRTNEQEAATVRHIFTAYATGKSPKAIAHTLNRQQVPGPSGEGWAPSTINGNWRRGTGILNNELYGGSTHYTALFRFLSEPGFSEVGDPLGPKS